MKTEVISLRIDRRLKRRIDNKRRDYHGVDVPLAAFLRMLLELGLKALDGRRK